MGRADAIVKLELDEDTLLMVTLAVEPLVTVSERVALPPATTGAKVKVPFPSVRFCWFVV